MSIDDNVMCDRNKAENMHEIISNECPTDSAMTSPGPEEKVEDAECPVNLSKTMNVCQDAIPSTSSQDFGLSNSHAEESFKENDERPEPPTVRDATKTFETEIERSPDISDQVNADEPTNVVPSNDKSMESKDQLLNATMEVDVPIETENNLLTVIQNTPANIFSEGNLL